MKETAILTIATKLTSSLSLFLNFHREKLISTDLSKLLINTLLPEFEPYFYKKGDPIVSLDTLSFSQTHTKCIEVYKFLKSFITFGDIITYGELGKRFDVHPRFIAYCMKINPFPVIIPCHRVISINGIGGYSAGVSIKKELLKHEGII